MKQTVTAAMKKVQSKYGDDVLFKLGSKERVLKRHTTGIAELDRVIGGGLPEGRIIEIYGANAAGKTSLALQIASQRAGTIFFDMEHTFDTDRATLFGNTAQSMTITRPLFGEHAFEQMYRYAEAGIDLIIVDSVPAMIPRAVHDQKDLEKNPGVALIPRLFSVRLPELVHIAHKSGTTVLFINQIRDKIGIIFPHADGVNTPGGHAFKHFASLRIQVNRKGFLLGPKKQKIGYLMRTRITKSKICAPTGDIEIPMLFDEGFVTHERVAEKRKELRP